jgi:hypothetical protein
VLSTPTFRYAAQRLGREIAALPDLGYAVDRLVELASSRQPLAARVA